MYLARSLISALLIVLMLPWGAYAGSTASRSTPQPFVAEMHVDVADASANKVGRAKQTSAALKKRNCRIASITGSPCTPERVLLDGSHTTFDEPSVTLPKSTPHWRLWGRSIAPPTAPPRLN